VRLEVLTIVIVVLLLGCAEMTAEQIAKNMEEKYRSIKDMQGEYTVTSYYGNEIFSQSWKIWTKENKMRQENDEMLMVSNGEISWIYDKKKNEVIKITSTSEFEEFFKEAFSYSRIIEELLNSYELKALGSEKINGRDCYVIDAKPKVENILGMKLKMWVEKEFWYPIKIEMEFDVLGNKSKSVVEYRNLSFNSGISDELFEFTPPPEAKILELKLQMPAKLTIEEAKRNVDFEILVPKYTAEYEFDYAMVSELDEEVSLLYKKGNSYLTIVESRNETLLPDSKIVKIGKVEGNISDLYGFKTLQFKCKDIYIRISSELSEEDLIKIAESFECN